MTTHLCDVNVWLALTVRSHVHHASCRHWLDSVDEPATVMFCRSTQQSYLRLLTTPAVLAAYGLEPLTNAAAWTAYEALIEDDRIVLQREEPEGLDRLWRQFTARQSASPKLWMDAYLAAFARAEGFRLVTLDAAFRQFNGLDVVVLEPEGRRALIPHRRRITKRPMRSRARSMSS